jgi:hypothetical protein
MYISNFIFFFLFIDMIERRFPNEFKTFIVESSIRCVYMYSLFQLQFIKINRFYRENFSAIEKELDNKVIKTFINDNISIISWQGKDYTNIRLLRNDEDICIGKYGECNFKFIMCQLIITCDSQKKCEYDLLLRTSDYNFYVEGNLINNDFINYHNFHLKRTTSFESDNSNSCSYKLTIIDNNATMINIDLNNESILLNKDSYTIVNKDSYIIVPCK